MLDWLGNGIGVLFVSKDREVSSYDSLEEIIQALQPGKTGNEITWVGKNYSKAQLIKDLEHLMYLKSASPAQIRLLKEKTEIKFKGGCGGGGMYISFGK